MWDLVLIFMPVVCTDEIASRQDCTDKSAKQKKNKHDLTPDLVSSYVVAMIKRRPGRSLSGRTPVPASDLELDLRASTEITQGVTQNHVGRIGVKKSRSDAGRARDASGRAFAICLSMTPEDKKVLDAIAAFHGTTRSGALRAALRYYTAMVVRPSI